MQQSVVTIVEHDPKTVQGRNGAFTIHKFKANDGTWYQTKKQDIANATYALLNQQATLVFETVVNGQYTNLQIESIVAGATAGAVTVNGATPAPATGGAPTSPVAPTTGGGGGFSAEDKLRVTRLSALSTIADLIAADVFPQPENRDKLFQMADILVGYAFDGRPSTQAAAPEESQAPAAAPPPEPAVHGGGDATAGQASVVAPVATPAAAPSGPSDAIPFLYSIF